MGSWWQKEENYYHFLIMLTCAWEACFMLISFSLTEKVLTLHQFKIIFFLINPQSNEHVPGTDITLSLQDYRANGGI